MKRRRWLAIASWVIASILALLVTAGASAHPKGTYVYNNRGTTVPMLSCADPACRVTYKLKNDSVVTMVCYTDATWFNGNYNSNRWFWVNYYDPTIKAARLGYVHSSYVYNQTKVPKCNFSSYSDPSNDGAVVRTPQSHGSAATPTTATGSTYVNNRYYSKVQMNNKPARFSDIVVWIPNGSTVTMLCWRDTENLPGANYSSPRWFKIRWSSWTGWVHSSYVYNQTKVGYC